MDKLIEKILLHKDFENACKRGDYKIVKNMCELNEIDVTYSNYLGFTDACIYGHFDIVKHLCEKYIIDINSIFIVYMNGFGFLYKLKKNGVVSWQGYYVEGLLIAREMILQYLLCLYKKHNKYQQMSNDNYFYIFKNNYKDKLQYILL